jgi:prolyl-tRNA editing enzyme YbaK/EbsC (Cys-tRNA(Pro) deacylase)
VQAALLQAGATGQVVELTESARTAAEAAQALGCPVAAIANSLIFAADGRPVLVLSSGGHRVDTAKVAVLVGAAQVRRADADLVREATGFAVGGVPPVGHRNALTTLVDTALADHAQVWAAAGTPYAVFPTTFDELVRITGGKPADVGAD